MCGLAGVFTFGGRPPGPEERRGAAEAVERLKHRGPDGSGLHEEECGIMAHARLAIMDLSRAGDQPFVRDSPYGDRIVCAVNGEIYNHEKLRRSLARLGAQFESGSDCEVLPLGFAFQSREIFAHLDGMYAAALYSRAENTLYLARDPRGKKPLFYSILPDRVIFASEIKGLEPLLASKPRISSQGLNLFLRLRYVPAPHTLLQGVHKLRPGELMAVRLDTGQISRSQRYCGLMISNFFSDLENPLSGLEQTLSRAVEKRLMSDVPVGALLSGGIDSGLIAALAREKFSYTLTGFTLDGPGDEPTLAAETAKRYNHPLRRVPIPTGSELIDLYRDLARSFDQPDTNLANLAIALLCRAAKEDGIKTVLTGDGADEIFFGYERYLKLLKRPWRAMARNWGLDSYVKDRAGTIKNYVRPEIWTKSPDLSQIDYIRGPEPKKPRIWNESLLDSELWVPEQANMRSDLNSMAFSVEIRCPFQDLDLIRLARNTPIKDHYLIRQPKFLLTPKAQLKSLARNRLSEPILSRKKTGFSTLLDREMAQGFQVWREGLSKENLNKTGIFSPDKINRAIRLYRACGRKPPEIIRFILLAQLWFLEKGVGG